MRSRWIRRVISCTMAFAMVFNMTAVMGIKRTDEKITDIIIRIIREKRKQ